MAPVSPCGQERSPDRGETGGTGRKRRRIAQACEECRERKRKCDGLRPVCGACSKRPGQSCVWNEERNNKGWTNNYVEGLKSRIKELEDALGAASQPWALGFSPTGLSPTNHSFPQTTILSPPRSHNEPAIPCTDDSSQGALNPQCHNGIANAHQEVSRLRPGTSITACSPHNPRDKPASPCSFVASEEPTVNDACTSIGSQEDTARAFESDSGDAEIDAMGVIGSATGGPILRTRRPSEYFGPSSTFCLLDEACSVINQRLLGACATNSRRHCGGFPDDEVASVSSNHRDPRSASGGRPSNGYKLAIPPRAEADGLLESYWTSVHSLYPFLHRPSFQRRYGSLWSSSADLADHSPHIVDDYYDDIGDRLFHCLLNITFALGALFNSTIAAEDRDGVSRSFFDRAKRFLDFDLLSCGSIALVQTLLLMGQYLQSTESPSSCWNMVGLAIRIAQGIGLHQEPKCCHRGTCTGNHDQLEVEMRRRTWTGCVLLDRVLSLTYGRPLMIRPTTVRHNFILPLAIDDEYLVRLPACPGKQPSGTTSMINCYVEAVKLQDILGQVLDTFYSRGPGDTTPESEGSTFDQALGSVNKSRIKDSDLHMLLNVDELLSQWHRKLPEHLRVQSHQTVENSSLSTDYHRKVLFKRQATVLQARFLHVQLTLLRPVLSVLCDSSQQTGPIDTEDDAGSMRGGMMTRAANLCVKAAQELVDLIIGNMDSRTDRLPAPWYNVFYIHSCAIVLLIGYLCSPQYITCMDESVLVASFKRCLTFFHAYEPHSQSAGRCSKILELLKQHIFRYRKGLAYAEGSETSLPDTGPGVEHFSTLHQDCLTDHGEFPQSNDMSTSYLFSNETFNQGSPGWMRETSDMTWLSLVPFFDNSLGGPLQF